ncbi:MAG: hypothetical protein ACLQJ0_24370 [Steroidobacteraceae bacterium]|jgi:hypothetical protein
MSWPTEQLDLAEPHLMPVPTPIIQHENPRTIREGRMSTYSVEKLGSCELEIFPMNQIAAENQS